MIAIKQKCRMVRALIASGSFLLLVGCSGISTSQVAQCTKIPERSIRVAAKCTYIAADVGAKTSDNGSRGVFVLTDQSICIYDAMDVTKISGAPIYQLRFHELDSVAIASGGLVRQLQFYQGNRVLAVTLWNQFEFADKAKAIQVHDYMTKHGLASRANCEIIAMRTSALTY
jgi:hypothetical protein